MVLAEGWSIHLTGPLGEAGGSPNLYQYANNDPVNRHDLLGLTLVHSEGEPIDPAEYNPDAVRAGAQERITRNHGVRFNGSITGIDVTGFSRADRNAFQQAREMQRAWLKMMEASSWIQLTNNDGEILSQFLVRNADILANNIAPYQFEGVFSGASVDTRDLSYGISNAVDISWIVRNASSTPDLGNPRGALLIEYGSDGRIYTTNSADALEEMFAGLIGSMVLTAEDQADSLIGGTDILGSIGMIAGDLVFRGRGGTLAQLNRGAAASSAPRMQTVRGLGRAGEIAAGVSRRRTQIPSLSGTASRRYPDQFADTFIREVKNTRHLNLTDQPRDFIDYAQLTNRQFILEVRTTTTFSGPLWELINRGTIAVIRNPGM